MMPFPVVAAADVVLAWNPSADSSLAGYNIYYGVASGNYTNMISAGNVTSVSIPGLVEGTTYYFAAKTYDATGLEGPFSNEVSYSVPVASLNPNPNPNPNPNQNLNPNQNQPPTLDPLYNFAIRGGSSAPVVALTGITAGAANGAPNLTILARSNNPQLIRNPITVNYTSPNPEGTLILNPGLGQLGTATITVTVDNGGAQNNTVTRSFDVTIVFAGDSTNIYFAPTLSSQLADCAAVVGQSPTLSIAAAGAGPLAYQWKLNATNLPAATNAVLTLNNVTASQAGAYSVMVSDPGGFTNSNTANLTIYSTASATLGSPVYARGQYAFSVSGVPGSQYAVQASSNLVNWVSLQTNPAPFMFVDPNAGQFRQRLYRAVYLP